MNNFLAHILVVDDDDGIRSLVKKFLNENNYLVTTADSAEDASDKIKIIKFDLIVLDIMMPGKNGLEFIDENKINQWIQFKKFKDAMEDMSQLNPAGIMIFISELYKITSSLLKSPFPKQFDKLPIYSRIKVVQTQIIKCHFYAANKQNEKLNQSLDELYLEYNILLKRIISMAEENKIQLDSFRLDQPNFQDSKMKPAFSRK